MKNPYYAKQARDKASGHWVVMKRLPASLGGGSTCVHVYTTGASCRDAARRAARTLNEK